MTTVSTCIVRPRSIEFYLIFSGYFFFMLRWGGNNNAIFLNLGALQIAVAVYAFIRYGAPSRALATLVLISLLLAGAQFFYPEILLDTHLPGSDASYIGASTKLLVYLFFISLHGMTIRPGDIPYLARAFLNLSRFSVLLAAVSIVLYRLIGVPVLLNFYFAEGMVRPQALLPEPSAFAPLAGMLLIAGYHWKSRKDLIWGIVAMLIPLSPITIMGGLAAFAVYTFLYEIRSLFLKVMTLMVAGAVIYYLMSLDCASLVVREESVPRTLGRMSCGLQVIFDPQLREAVQGVFLNLRLLSTLTSIDILAHTGTFMSGLGLNSSSIFMPELYGELRENSIWISVLLFYGIPGMVIFALLCVSALWRLSHAPKYFAAIFVTVLTCSTINSAGGFYLYAFIFWGIAFAFTRHCSVERPSVIGGSSPSRRQFA